MKANEIYKTYSKEYKEATKFLLEKADLAGQIKDNAKCIGIKPNLVSPTPAEYGATTHPEVVAGIIEYLKEHGFTNLLMIEGSWIGDKTSDSYEFCGFRELTETYQVPFIDTQKEKYHAKECNGMTLNICDAVDTIDFLINVPVLKGHGQTKITCALKNMKGLIPNTEKRHFHTMGLHKPIAHLSTGIHQDFIVVDHICGDLDFEDGGNPVERNCIMTALDPVLVDSYVCQLLGYKKEDVPYIVMAEELGSGSTDLANCLVSVFDFLNVASLPVDSNNNLYTKVPLTEDAFNNESDSKPPLMHTYSGLEEDPGEHKLRPKDKVLEISYAIDDADSCSACYASLAPALFRLKEEGLLKDFPYKIAIGQGHQGQSGKLGIGRCCSNYEITIKGCPPDEEEVYEALKALITEQHLK